MLIKELLRHVYPACKVKVYFTINNRGFVEEYLACELNDGVSDDAECDDWAMCEDHLCLFVG